MPPKPGALWEALAGDADFLFSLSSLSFAVAPRGKCEHGLGGAASRWVNQ